MSINVQVLVSLSARESGPWWLVTSETWSLSINVHVLVSLSARESGPWWLVTSETWSLSINVHVLVEGDKENMEMKGHQLKLWIEGVLWMIVTFGLKTCDKCIYKLKTIYYYCISDVRSP